MLERIVLSLLNFPDLFSLMFKKEFGKKEADAIFDMAGNNQFVPKSYINKAANYYEQNGDYYLAGSLAIFKNNHKRAIFDLLKSGRIYLAENIAMKNSVPYKEYEDLKQKAQSKEISFSCS